jgi:hypothetical protein
VSDAEGAAVEPATGPEPHPGGSGDAAAWRRVRRLSHLLDSNFTVPGTNARFGIDGLLGLVPGIGDAAGLAASSLVIAEGVRLGARGWVLVRMLLTAGLDALVGAVPLLGSIFDFAFKANNRNLALLERHVQDPHGARDDARRSVVWTLVAVAVVTVLLIAAVAAAGLALLGLLF